MNHVEAFLARVHDAYDVVLRFQALLQGLSQLHFVLYYQDAHAYLHSSGRRLKNPWYLS